MVSLPRITIPKSLSLGHPIRGTIEHTLSLQILPLNSTSEPTSLLKTSPLPHKWCEVSEQTALNTSQAYVLQCHCCKYMHGNK